MKKYVSRVIVMRNGTRIRDFKNYKDIGTTDRTQVQLMEGNGVVDNTPQYGFSIDYVLPVVNPKQDWTDVENETWTVAPREGGSKTTYTGVTYLSVGDLDTDGQKEAVRTVTFAAEGKIYE